MPFLPNLSEISKSSIYFCNLKTKLKVLETLTQLFMSKTWQSFVQRCVFPRVSFLSKFETLVKGLQLFWMKGPRTIFHKVLKFPFRTKVEKLFLNNFIHIAFRIFFWHYVITTMRLLMSSMNLTFCFEHFEKMRYYMRIIFSFLISKVNYIIVNNVNLWFFRHFDTTTNEELESRAQSCEDARNNNGRIPSLLAAIFPLVSNESVLWQWL